MKELVVNSLSNTTNLVDRFEGSQEGKYDRLVVLDIMRGPYSFLEKVCFGFIIERAEYKPDTWLTISKLYNFGFYNPIIEKYYHKREEYYSCGTKDIMLPEEEHIYFRAQASKDRYGFYKKYDCMGNLIENKEYGHTSYCYKIVGFRLSETKWR